MAASPRLWGVVEGPHLTGEAPEASVEFGPMPKISAATVAEHRAARERALLDAAHAILLETGEPPRLADVAARAGLARTSAYQYFGSQLDLLKAMVQDVYPQWTKRIRGAMAAAPTDADRILAYAVANVELVDEGAHAVGSTLAALDPDAALDEEAVRMHREVQEPLIAALTALDVDAPAEIQVNPSFSLAEAVAAAERYAPMIGRLPRELRAELRSVWIHEGDYVLGGGEGSILVHTGVAELLARSALLEENLLWVSALTSLAAEHAGAEGWLAAQKKDGEHISTHAASDPVMNDLAESFFAYYALRHRGGRLPASATKINVPRISAMPPTRMRLSKRVMATL